MAKRTAVVLLTACLLIGPLTLSTLATTEYELSAEPSIDTPDRTVTYDGNEFTLTGITQTATDATVEITAVTPSEESYYLQFRNPENAVIERVFRTGQSSYSIDFYGEGQAGTYAVLLRQDGEFRAIHPIIVPGYDVSVSAPETVESDDELTVTAAISELSVDRHSDLSNVELVLYNQEHDIRAQMELNQSGSYTQTIAANQLERGTYDVSVVVRGDAEVRGQDEILAVSGQQSLTVTEVSTPTPTETQTSTSTPETSPSEGSDDSAGGENNDPPNAGGGNTQTEGQTESTAEVTSTPMQTAVPTTMDAPPTQTTTVREEQSVTEEVTQTDQLTEESSTVGGVLEPNTAQTETPEASTTAGSGPGFTHLLTIVAIVSTILYTRIG